MNNVPNSAAAGCLLTFQAESLAPCTILTAQLPFPKPTLTKNQLNMSHKYMLHRINRYNCVLKTVSNGKVIEDNGGQDGHSWSFFQVSVK